MAQIFHPSMNTIAKASIFGAVFIVAGISVVVSVIDRSSWATGAGVVRDQPIPFSHEHHVSGLGIDCRYCHTSVEDSKFAGIPPTKTCMSCHSQIWTNAQMLEPVRQSWRTNTPIRWQRVHNLPGYVYFNHSIHVNKGVGCSTCHGNVAEMPLMYQSGTLLMEWCLKCHREPERYLRPRDQIFNMEWDDRPRTVSAFGKTYDLPHDQMKLGGELAQQYHVLSLQQMQNCSTCHR